MKANELRIGNIVKGPNCEFAISNGSTIDFCKEFTPIPLTKEWLVKFGFKRKHFKSTGTDHFTIGEVTIFCDTISGSIVYDMLITINAINLDYVHQLQNLYFALTGEELTITA